MEIVLVKIKELKKNAENPRMCIMILINFASWQQQEVNGFDLLKAIPIILVLNQKACQ